MTATAAAGRSFLALESPANVTNAAAELGLVTPTERVHLAPVVADASAPSIDHS